MKSPVRSPRATALLVLLLAVFVGAQLGVVGHLHTDGGLAADCLQCQLDPGQALLPSAVHPAGVPSLHVAIGPEPVSASLEPIYRLNARGPPLISC